MKKIDGGDGETIRADLDEVITEYNIVDTVATIDSCAAQIKVTIIFLEMS